MVPIFLSGELKRVQMNLRKRKLQKIVELRKLAKNIQLTHFGTDVQLIKRIIAAMQRPVSR
jgi:hypothetical protein